MFQKTLAFKIFFTVSLILIGCFVFLPLLWMINTALKPSDQTFSLYFFTGPLTLDNIIGILTDKTIMNYLKNSLIVSFLSSFMATLVSSFAAYSFSKFRYRGRKIVMGAFMMSQAFPQAILLLSIYLMMQRFGLLGSYWSLLISYVVFTLPVGTWTLKGYFDGIPDSLIDGSARHGINRNLRFCMVMERFVVRDDTCHGPRKAHACTRTCHDIPWRGKHQLGGHDECINSRGNSSDTDLHLPSALLHRRTHKRCCQGMIDRTTRTEPERAWAGFLFPLFLQLASLWLK